MADFQEWMDAAGYDAAADEAVDLFGEGVGGSDADAALRNQRDAVLFCIDGRAASFQGDAAPFASFVKHAIRFCQDKIITSDKDLVGVVLFGTEQQCNVHGFPSLYVFHELDLNSAARVQELELLATAATAGSPLAAEYKAKIGHCDVKREIGTSGVVTAGAPFAMSELLWAILHMFNHLGTKKVGFRRAFIFTCDDDPVATNPIERAKCFARARDLREHGIFLEVFGHGYDVSPMAWMTPLSGSGAGTGSSGSGMVHITPSSGLYPSTLHGAATSRPPSLSAGRAESPHPAVFVTGPSPHLTPPAPVTVSMPMPALTPPVVVAHAATAGPPTAALPPFDRQRFWEPLLSVASAVDGRLSTSTERDQSLGSVHVADMARGAFDGTLADHRIRTYPQRSVGTINLSLGPDLSAPSVAVSVYLPVVKCTKPKFIWLEAATNALVTSESRMLGRESAVPVTPDDLVHTAKIGASDHVEFAAEDVSKLRTQFGTPGLRVLGFRAESHLRAKWSIGRSSFLHPNEEQCGQQGMVLFAELHRVLRTTRRYAIVEVIARNGASPRLAAMIAAGNDNTAPAALEQGSVGFHLFPLPYADDYRTLNLPSDSHVKAAPDAVRAAAKVIKKLTVDYDPTAVPNPALQHQYFALQQLAVLDDTQRPPEDLSLPDREGMHTFAPLFDEFKRAVWGDAAATYNADAIAPPPKAAKPPPTAAEMAGIDMDALEAGGQLSSLTMPFLKQYLKDHHESTSGVKQDLIERVSKLVQKKRGKRERDGEGPGREEGH